MRTERSVIDYSLAKRAVLVELLSGQASGMDVCDAHPYLLRAAKYHGEPTDEACPLCRKPLTHVTYAYGDELRESSGRVRATAELAAIARDHQEVSVYVVEVCRACSWNHLARSFVIGRGGAVPERRRRGRTAAEQ